MKLLASVAMQLLVVAVLALFLPTLYDMALVEDIRKTQLFYSPVTERFIYTEKAAVADPRAAAKADDHHADVVYKDQDGTYYDRLEFERLLPFLYHKNLALRGLLPVEIDGRTYDLDTIQAERLVMELPARTVTGHTPPEAVWPLIESRPGQAMLVFPDDRFRITDSAMEFVNADANAVDATLTRTFTAALRERGFVFPARLVAGNFTILKPYEDGVLLVDARGTLFHLLRVEGRPQVARVALPAGLRLRHVSVSGSGSGRFHGLLVDQGGGVHLLARGYGVIPLPLEGYDPGRMDLKILFDPLYRTAVYSDETTLRAVVMDRNYRPLARYEHAMSTGARTWRHALRDVLLPFRVTLRAPDTSMIRPGVRAGAYPLSWSALASALLALGYAGWSRARRGRWPAWGGVALVCVAGVYGFAARLVVEEE